MESLLQNLYEQQIQLQQYLYIYDLANMENANNGKPPLPPPRKYVSIFCIDGEPILPPLMTTEKRRQMEKLKEKALKIEQRLRECKRGRMDREYYPCNEDMKILNSQSSLNQTADNISLRSQDYTESKLKETEDSLVFLKTLIKRQQEEAEVNSTQTVNTASNTSATFYGDKNQEKLKKLQKSEILIYDNSTNEVTQVLAEKENAMESEAFVPNEKLSHLLLAGVNSRGMASIPSIRLNPPTPLAVNKTLFDNLSGEESNESLINSETINKSLDLSSDESFNSMITQSDNKSNRNMRQHNSDLASKGDNSKNGERKPITPVKNVCAKIQQFEAISSDTNTPETSPEKLYKNRKICLGTPTGTMNRSATNPSIKTTSNRSSSSRSQSFAQDSDNSPENALVRSSSFTLEGPSKALIDHMQQQKVISDNKATVKSPLNTTRNLSRKILSSPLRAHRDTVESKAKKVQKVELKSSKQKIQQKASQSKLAQAAAASISPLLSNTPTQHVNNLRKTKRSPYEISKTSHTSLQPLQKTFSTQMRKSNSTSSNLAQSKTSKSRSANSSTSTSCNSAKTPQTGKESLNQMDKAQRDKFMQLLAQQEEEHRRLQQSFEMQQKLLIQQLNREMATSQLKSPHNSYNSLSTTRTSQQKRFLQQQILSPQQLQPINSTGSAASFDLTRLKSTTIHHQSPPSISRKSSYISFDKNQCQTSNSHQNSSYVSHYSQPSQSLHLNNSHLSLMDHSNANTSLDISTLSTQTSPGTLCSTPPIQNNNVCNTLVNKISSSRRRLFTTEVNDVGVDGNDASSPYISNQSFVEQGNQPQQLNHRDESSRRVQAGNLSILHAAATKINAYARGFLVRRLFQTEQIQRVVQTIHDTLIFVLNLHIETIENPEESQTPANIKLKARLLQQLSSACRTLHLVFFQTSIKERMEIIARDRKRIKTKLISINRKRGLLCNSNRLKMHSKCNAGNIKIRAVFFSNQITEQPLRFVCKNLFLIFHTLF